MLYLVYFIYFFCGMTLCFEGAFNPELKDYFQLNYQQQQYTTFTKNLPFVMAVFIGYSISRIGYKNCLTIAMGLFSAGTLMLIPGLQTGNYYIVLAAFFIIGLGFNFELVAGNPLLSMLGSPEGSSSRLNLANALGAIAQIIAPIMLTLIIPASALTLQDKLPYMKGLFGVIGALLFAIAIVTLLAPPVKEPEVPKTFANSQDGTKFSQSVWTHPKIIFGFMAIFLALGIEAGLFGFYRNYLEDPPPFSSSRIKNLPTLAARLTSDRPDAISALLRVHISPDLQQKLLETAKSGNLDISLSVRLADAFNQICTKTVFDGQHLFPPGISPDLQNQLRKPQSARELIKLNRLIIGDAYSAEISRVHYNARESQRMFTVYFAVYALGRLAGAFAQKKIRPATTLVVCAAAALLLLGLITTTQGRVAAASVTIIGFFVSIFFPTLFALAIEGLGIQTAQASGILTMGFLGCAIVPVFQGWLADQIGLKASYALGFGPYIFVLFYALKGHKLQRMASTELSTDILKDKRCV